MASLPRNPQRAVSQPVRQLAALAAAYNENRDDVLRIVSGSLSQITAFSDAFRLPRR